MKQPKQANNLMDLFQKDKEPFTVFSAPINSAHKVVIDEEFHSVFQFADIVDVLDNAQEGDVVQIKLSTNGGALHAIVPLVNAMKNTYAHVHIHVESDTSSAGTILMMLADSCYVNEYATAMLHTAQYAYGGHSGNMDAHVGFATKAIEKLVRDVYTDWLSEEEIHRLLDGKEFYFSAEECHERFKARDAKWKTEECSCEDCEENDSPELNKEVEEMLEIMKKWDAEGAPTNEVVKPAQKSARKPRTKKEDK